jgi:hypothetical protein
MTGNFLLKTDKVEISPTVAKFGVTTYQVANIESLTVGQRRRMNPLALIPLSFGFGLLASGFAVGGHLSGSFLDNLRDGPATYLFGTGILLVTLVRAGEKCRRHVESEGLGGCEVITKSNLVGSSTGRPAVRAPFKNPSNVTEGMLRGGLKSLRP